MASDGLFLPPQVLGIVCWDAEGHPVPSATALEVLAAPDDASVTEARERLHQMLSLSGLPELLGQGEGAVQVVPPWAEEQVLLVSLSRPCGHAILALTDIGPQQRLARLQQDFVANVSHELRTPLTSIRMAAESLQMGAMASETLRSKFASNIQREAERLTRLVNEILVVANLRGRPVLHLSDFAPLDLAQEVVTTLEPHAVLNHVDLRLEAPEGLPLVRWDRDRIHQVILNLVDNAIKFTPAEGRVTLRFALMGEGLEIRVVDTGIGIPEIDRPRIFDRFYRVDKSRSRVTGGVGLGLSIVKDLIVAHRGSIEVESQINSGTQFIIRMPLRAETNIAV
ncbi:MAG: ATP-binding protein [Candidatus Sericytochromatia bacterium]|nr:ATP-binding protein [Candidatus Sericytochromatia bacterium]